MPSKCSRLPWSALTVLAIIACGDRSPSDPMPDQLAPLDGVCPEGWERPFAVSEQDYPFTSRCARFEPGILHYIDEVPEGPVRGTVVAVHGNPTWSFLYRKITTPLVQSGFRVVVPDLYGFGMSDKPDPLDFDYRASAHAEVLTRFVEAAELHDVILVVQDWGGPVGLSMAAELPERIAGLLVINTWAWEVPRVTSGSTSYMHVIHDWGAENVINRAYYETSMQTARRAGLGLGRRNGEPDSEIFTRIRDAYWGPFFAPDEPYDALGPDVVTPVNRFAEALLTDWQFLSDLDRRMPALYDTPVSFMFGDDTAFGPTKCDTGPTFRYDHEQPRVEWSDQRALCPTTLQCADQPPEPLRSNCVDEQGEPHWGILERFLERWAPKSVVEVWTEPDAGHWIQETHPLEVVDAIETLAAAAD